MQVAKRIFLFLVLNVLIITSITFFLKITGLEQMLYGYGGDYPKMFIFCLVWGMGGAFISLMLSKTFAKSAMGVQVIDPRTQDPDTRRLVNLVHDIAKKAKLRTMPEVGIYESPEVNAFATGPTKNNSIVAVSTGLLHRMDEEQVTGVLSHEVSHIANGDMVTLTIVQGVVNSFVMFFTRIIAEMVAKDRDGRVNPGIYFLVSFVAQIALMFLAIPLITAVSRWREYRADLGSARLTGKHRMISALKALQNQTTLDNREPAFSAFKISGKKSHGLMQYFMTHPPLESRIAALERARI